MPGMNNDSMIPKKGQRRICIATRTGKTAVSALTRRTCLTLDRRKSLLVSHRTKVKKRGLVMIPFSPSRAFPGWACLYSSRLSKPLVSFVSSCTCQYTCQRHVGMCTYPRALSNLDDPAHHPAMHSHQTLAWLS